MKDAQVHAFSVQIFPPEGNSPDLQARHRAIEQLIAHCDQMPALADVIRKHRLGSADLEEFFRQLERVGAGQWVGDHYVPASAISHAPALSFLCEQADRLDWHLMGVLLIEYFERNESGPVPLQLRGPTDPNHPLKPLYDAVHGGENADE